MSNVTLTFAETTIDQSVEVLSYGLDNGGVTVRFAEGSKRADQLWAHPTSLSWTLLSLHGGASGWGVKLDT
jgi:hypothetical protein